MPFLVKVKSTLKNFIISLINNSVHQTRTFGLFEWQTVLIGKKCQSKSYKSVTSLNKGVHSICEKDP